MQLRRSLLVVAAACACALPAFPQANFQYQSYATPNDANVALTTVSSKAFDFNGDGYADVLAPSSFTCSGASCKLAATLYLYMNNGSGSLKAPVRLPVGLKGGSFLSMSQQVAVADFNGDQKLDIAALNASGGITILYGNGDGTFQAPVDLTLSGGTYTSLVTADFDDNGTADLGALKQAGMLVLEFNDGKGNFTAQSMQVDTPPAGYTTTNLAVGNFTGSGRADIAWVEQGDANSQTNTVYARLNTAKGVFGAKKEVGTTIAGFGEALAADFELTGKSGLITFASQLTENCCATNDNVMWYRSNGDGTFMGNVLDTPDPTPESVSVADINGDGIPDLVEATDNTVNVLEGKGNGSTDGSQPYTSLPGGAMQLGFGFFYSSNRVGFAAPNGGGATGGNYPNDFYVVQNDDAQEGCPYPQTAGIRICQSTQWDDQNVQLVGTARAQTAPVQRIEIWANGQRMWDEWADEFNATLDLPPNTPITVTEVEANGATKSTTVTVQSTCPAPSSPGVNVCSPTANENFSNSEAVSVLATGTGASGSVNHMELWLDGSKQGNYPGASVDASLNPTPGTHTLIVIEVDSKGNYIKSAPVTFTYNGSPACATPSSPGVHVCSPTPGETVSSPVGFDASGTGASGSVNHMELWIDGNKVGNYSGDSLITQVSEAAGSHSATIIEVDSKGNYVKTAPVTYTVR